MRHFISLLAILLLPVITSAAEIYQWTDASGNVHFSDRANSHAKEVNLNPNRPLTPQKHTPKQRAPTTAKAVTRGIGTRGVSRTISSSKHE